MTVSRASKEGKKRSPKASVVAVMVALALGALGVLGASGCATYGRKWESRSIVQHYETMRNQLKKKERSGAEGGCPTCVY